MRAVHRQRRDALRGQPLHQLGVLTRPQKGDQHLPFVQPLHFVVAERRMLLRSPDLENDVAVGPQPLGLRDDRGTGLCVGFIAEARSFARAGLHGDAESELAQFGDDLRCRRYALLAGVDFGRNSYLHRGPLQLKDLGRKAWARAIEPRRVGTGTRL